jgi:hypothetical protein
LAVRTNNDWVWIEQNDWFLEFKEAYFFVKTSNLQMSKRKQIFSKNQNSVQDSIDWFFKLFAVNGLMIFLLVVNDFFKSKSDFLFNWLE